MIPKAILWLLALVCLRGVLGAPTSRKNTRITIGYRRVHPNQAEKYNKAGTLTDDPITGYTQIGQGVYLSAEYGAWEGQPGDIDCIITVDDNAFRQVPKVILPDDQLSDSNHEDIDEYIKELDSTWDPEKTVRISHIPKYGLGNDIYQMVIPSTLLNSRGGGLDIRAECKDGHAIQGPTVDYGQWENAKGAKLKRLSNTDKIKVLPDMLDKVNGLIDSASALSHIELLELRATNAMYTAGEGAGELAEYAQECQGVGELKKLCKDMFKWHIRDREAYANFLVKASRKSLEVLGKSLNEKEDAATRSKAAQDLKDWAARLQDKVDAKMNKLKAVKNKDPAAIPGGNPKLLAIEKEALERELVVMKKGLSKVADDAAALEAKESTPSESKDKGKVQRFKEWLGKTWAKIVLPSKGNEAEGDSRPPTADNPDDDKPPPPNPFKQGKKPSEGQPTEDDDKPPPPNPFKQGKKPSEGQPTEDDDKPPPPNPLKQGKKPSEGQPTEDDDKPPPPNPLKQGKKPSEGQPTADDDKPPPPNPFKQGKKPVEPPEDTTSDHSKPGGANKKPKPPKGRTRRHF